MLCVCKLVGCADQGVRRAGGGYGASPKAPRACRRGKEKQLLLNTWRTADCRKQWTQYRANMSARVLVYVCVSVCLLWRWESEGKNMALLLQQQQQQQQQHGMNMNISTTGFFITSKYAVSGKMGTEGGGGGGVCSGTGTNSKGTYYKMQALGTCVWTNQVAGQHAQKLSCKGNNKVVSLVASSFVDGNCQLPTIQLGGPKNKRVLRHEAACVPNGGGVANVGATGYSCTSDPQALSRVPGVHRSIFSSSSCSTSSLLQKEIWPMHTCLPINEPSSRYAAFKIHGCSLNAENGVNAFTFDTSLFTYSDCADSSSSTSPQSGGEVLRGNFPPPGTTTTDTNIGSSSSSSDSGYTLNQCVRVPLALISKQENQDVFPDTNATLFSYTNCINLAPTMLPSPIPTAKPTSLPTPSPSPQPTPEPTPLPSALPTIIPTPAPSSLPTVLPSPKPTTSPTPPPSTLPTAYPTYFGIWTEKDLGNSPSLLDNGYFVGYAMSSTGATMIGAGLADPNLYLSYDSGTTWTRKNVNSAISDQFNVAMSGDGTKMIVIGKGGGTYYTMKSVDSGNTWSSMSVPNAATSITVTPDWKNIIIFDQQRSIQVSRDGGATFTNMDPIALSGGTAGLASSICATSYITQAVAISDDGQTIVAGAWDAFGSAHNVPYPGCLFVSTNGGTSFSQPNGAANSPVGSWIQSQFKSLSMSSDGKYIVASAQDVGFSGYGFNPPVSTQTWFSSNKGATWSIVAASSYTSAISLKSQTIAIFVRNSLTYSTDMGVTWKNYDNSGALSNSGWRHTQCFFDVTGSILGCGRSSMPFAVGYYLA